MLKRVLLKSFIIMIIISLLGFFYFIEESKKQEENYLEGVIPAEYIPPLKKIKKEKNDFYGRYLTPSYYVQHNNPWGEREYGDFLFKDTGCVPTCLSMVIEPLINKKVEPDEIGELLYEEGYLNSEYFGAGSNAIIYVLDYYHLDYSFPKTFEELEKELNEGKLVLAAIGESEFCHKGYTHELVLFNLEDGYVDVYDPLNNFHNQKYKLDYIYDIKSWATEDNYYGSPFISVYRDINIKDKVN